MEDAKDPNVKERLYTEQAAENQKLRARVSQISNALASLEFARRSTGTGDSNETKKWIDKAIAELGGTL